MSSDFLSTLAEREDLLFVTSDSAIQSMKLSSDVATLKQTLGGHLHIVSKTDVITGTSDLRRYIATHSWMKGVVIIGHYSDVPSRTVKCLDPALLERLSPEPRDERAEGGSSEPNADIDEWWTWNDDIYGSGDEDTFLPQLPVSRIPIVPGSLVAPGSPSPSPTFLGVRGNEFPFVDVIHDEILQGVGNMEQSPPIATNPPTNPSLPSTTRRLSEAELAVDWLYLVLHHPNTATLKLTGTPMTDLAWQPVALDHTMFKGTSRLPSVVFGGICWGAMLVDQMACTNFNTGGSFKDFDVTRSVPIAYVNKGTSAFVGFTTQHHLPVTGSLEEAPSSLDALTLGAPLHRYFWDNLVAGKAPAEALFLAKARVVGSLDAETMHPLALAQTLKSVWSATCIGLGW